MGYGRGNSGVGYTCKDIDAAKSELDAVKDFLHDLGSGNLTLNEINEGAEKHHAALEAIINQSMESLRTANSELRDYGEEQHERAEKLEKERDQFERECTDKQEKIEELESEVVELKDQISELEFGGQTEEA